eukprot:7378024-Prymnesium_polylepis.2
MPPLEDLAAAAARRPSRQDASTILGSRAAHHPAPCLPPPRARPTPLLASEGFDRKDIGAMRVASVSGASGGAGPKTACAAACASSFSARPSSKTTCAAGWRKAAAMMQSIWRRAKGRSRNGRAVNR